MKDPNCWPLFIAYFVDHPKRLSCYIVVHYQWTWAVLHLWSHYRWQVRLYQVIHRVTLGMEKYTKVRIKAILCQGVKVMEIFWDICPHLWRQGRMEGGFTLSLFWEGKDPNIWHSQFFLQILEESQFSCLAACQGRIKSSPSKSIPCTNVPITNTLGRASQKNTEKWSYHVLLVKICWYLKEKYKTKNSFVAFLVQMSPSSAHLDGKPEKYSEVILSCITGKNLFVFEGKITKQRTLL